MTMIIIDQKMSGTGSIQDLASDQYSIEINMGDQYQYAVLLPSYFKTDSTRHKSAHAAVDQYNALKNRGYDYVAVLDRQGNEVDIEDFKNES